MVLGFGGQAKSPASISARKRASRDDDIKRAEGRLGAVALADDLPFLSCPAGDIARRIGAKEKGWTATRVLEAFARAALRSHESTNALTEVMFDEAFIRAEELDAAFAKTGKVVGPLHGVPMSLKDQIDVKGVDSSLGGSKDCFTPSEANAPVVDIIIAAGAVPFVKTNVPQSMLSFECSNPVFGISRNPYSPSQVPGGSSGGEAALLASDGSPLGVGSDIGGSLRIPAHFSGCYGLKPSAGRWPSGGTRSPTPGFTGISSTLGPMGRSVDDLELLSRVVIEAEAGGRHKIDGTFPVPWRPAKLSKKLKIGYFVHDGLARTSPACQRAVETAVKAMASKGHDTVAIEPPNIVRAMEIFVALTSSDGYKTLFNFIGRDPREAFLFLLGLGPSLPGFVRASASVAVSMYGDSKFATILSAAREKSVTELLTWQKARQVFSADLHKRLWQELGLDAVICPVQATPALPVGSTNTLSPLAAATILWNVADATVAVAPVITVDPQLDQPRVDDARNAPAGSALLEKNLYDAKTSSGAPLYDVSRAMKGLPVGVQVVGPTYSDETILAILRELDGALGQRIFCPGRFAQRRG